MKSCFLSSDWETASLKDLKQHLMIIESMHEGGLRLRSRLGSYDETVKYLKAKISQKED